MANMIKKFRMLEAGLAADVYYDKQRKTFSGVGMFLFGFPAFPGANIAIQKMTEAGLVVINPHWFGTYDSEGLFSPDSMVDTIRKCGQLVSRGYLTNAKNGACFEVPAHWSAIVGHSFGCAAALRSSGSLPHLENLILLAPTAHYGTGDRDFGVREDGLAQLEYVRTTHPYTYRISPSSTWVEMLTGKDRGKPKGAPPRRAVIVFGSDDTYFDTRIAQMRMADLVHEYTGYKETKVVVLPGKGHSLVDLVSNPPLFDLGAYVHQSKN